MSQETKDFGESRNMIGTLILPRSINPIATLFTLTLYSNLLYILRPANIGSTHTNTNPNKQSNILLQYYYNYTLPLTTTSNFPAFHTLSPLKSLALFLPSPPATQKPNIGTSPLIDSLIPCLLAPHSSTCPSTPSITHMVARERCSLVLTE